MEKNGYFANSSRSLLGLIFFTTLSCSFLNASLLVDESFFVQPTPFSYKGVESISFYVSSEDSVKIPLSSLIKSALKDKVSISSNEQGVQKESLLADMQAYITIKKGLEKEVVSVSIGAWVNGESAKKYRGKIPVFSRFLVCNKENEDSIEKAIIDCLQNWLTDVHKETQQTIKVFIL